MDIDGSFFSLRQSYGELAVSAK